MSQIFNESLLNKCIRDFKQVGQVRNLLIDGELKIVDFTNVEYLLQQDTCTLLVYPKVNDEFQFIIIDHNFSQLNSIILMQKGIDLKLENNECEESCSKSLSKQ